MADMPKNTDDLKGRAKKATGELTDDDDLEEEGVIDKATGAVKDAVDTVAEKAKELAGKKSS